MLAAPSTHHRAFARAVLLAAAALAGCGLAACGTATPNPAGGQGTLIVAKDAANGTTVHLHVGDRVEVALASTYWTVRGSSAPAVVHQDGATITQPAPQGSCVPGEGCGVERTYFTARSAGTAVITAGRTTCGEALRCVGSRGRFKLTVQVG
jgi:hypothetical protein